MSERTDSDFLDHIADRGGKKSIFIHKRNDQ